MTEQVIHLLAQTKPNKFIIETSKEVALWIYNTFEANKEFVGEIPYHSLTKFCVTEKVYIMAQLRWAS